MNKKFLIEIAKLIIYFIVGCIIGYGLMSFICWSLNPGALNGAARFGIIWFGILLTVVFEIIENVRNE